MTDDQALDELEKEIRDHVEGAMLRINIRQLLDSAGKAIAALRLEASAQRVRELQDEETIASLRRQLDAYKMSRQLNTNKT